MEEISFFMHIIIQILVILPRHAHLLVRGCCFVFCLYKTKIQIKPLSTI